MSLSVFELKPNMFLDPRFKGKKPLNQYDQDIYKGFYSQIGTRNGRDAERVSVPENFYQLVKAPALAMKFPATIKNQRLSQAQ